MRAAWSLVLLVLSSGCIATGPEDKGDVDGGDCPTAQAFWLPAGEQGPLQTDGVERSDIVAFFPEAPAVRIAGYDLPERWKWDVETIGPGDDNGSLVRVGLTAASGMGVPNSRDGSKTPSLPRPVQLNWTTVATPDCAEKATSNSWMPAYTAADRRVQAGDGVSVLYAGFWLNGTLFSTNIADVDSSGWPRGGWYESEAGGPLNVYVYDKDRSERAAFWAPTDPSTNRPVDWAYYPTIEGFNNGLKGLSLGSTRVVVIPPEKAYTQPGRESHILYGDSLVFFIDVVEIVDVPCPPEVVNRAACRLPS